MKGVRLLTDRLVIRDLPPRYSEAVAAFHRENLQFHRQWDPVRPPEYFTAAEQRGRLRAMRRSPDAIGLWMIAKDGGKPAKPLALIGAITLSSIIRGALCSCFLGYKLDARFTRRGYMREALASVVTYAFTTLGLHRLEANIMPANERSLRLVSALGFTAEGTARRYLEIQNTWEDHIHMVMLSDDWENRT